MVVGPGPTDVVPPSPADAAAGGFQVVQPGMAVARARSDDDDEQSHDEDI